MAKAKTVKKAPRKRARKTTKAKARTKPAKKASAKPAKKIEVYKLARPASGERYFILANGKPVRHVAHLAEILEDLEDHVFDHHVSPNQNDFATWVQDVFEDIELAKKMLSVDSKEKLQLIIYKHAAHKAFAQKR